MLVIVMISSNSSNTNNSDSDSNNNTDNNDDTTTTTTTTTNTNNHTSGVQVLCVSTAEIYTCTPNIQNTICLFLTRCCRYLLVEMYAFMSRDVS